MNHSILSTTIRAHPCQIRVLRGMFMLNSPHRDRGEEASRGGVSSAPYVPIPAHYLQREQDDQIDLADYTRVLWRRRFLILVGTLACALTAFVLSVMIPPVYQTRATFILQSLLPAFRGLNWIRLRRLAVSWPVVELRDSLDTTSWQLLLVFLQLGRPTSNSNSPSWHQNVRASFSI